jgi:hypothetical protein
LQIQRRNSYIFFCINDEDRFAEPPCSGSHFEQKEKSTTLPGFYFLKLNSQLPVLKSINKIGIWFLTVHFNFCVTLILYVCVCARLRACLYLLAMRVILYLNVFLCQYMLFSVLFVIACLEV